MRICNRHKEVKGSGIAGQRSIRFKYMIQEEAQKRARILTFWKKYGLSATVEAFCVSERTLFRWQAALQSRQGKLEALNNTSRAPHNKRIRRIASDLQESIIDLRTQYPRIGKAKLPILLKKRGFTVTESTVGRILTDLKRKNLLPTYKKVSLMARTGRIHTHTPIYRKKLRKPKELMNVYKLTLL